MEVLGGILLILRPQCIKKEGGGEVFTGLGLHQSPTEIAAK
jgi:hypothetical protein